MTKRPGSPPPADAGVVAAELRSLVGKLKRRLRGQAGADELTGTQTAVLKYLEKDGPMTISALARVEGMRPQSMGAAIAPLENASFVVGKPDPSDIGRQTLYELTAACRTWIDEGRNARQDWLARALRERLSDPEIAQLAAAVDLLKRLAED